MLDTRRQLRDVQFELRRDIQQLETWIRAINIGAIPAAIGVFAFGEAMSWVRAASMLLIIAGVAGLPLSSSH